jgi:hypothetical protein
MFVTETINFAVGSALFVHAVFKAIVAYVNENKLPCDAACGDDQVRYGRGGIRRVAEHQAAVKTSLPPQLPTAVDIKRALPKHVFESSVPLSMYYVIKDFVLVISHCTRCCCSVKRMKYFERNILRVTVSGFVFGSTVKN